jgi:hypothetical protein
VPTRAGRRERSGVDPRSVCRCSNALMVDATAGHVVTAGSRGGTRRTCHARVEGSKEETDAPRLFARAFVYKTHFSYFSRLYDILSDSQGMPGCWPHPCHAPWTFGVGYHIIVLYYTSPCELGAKFTNEGSPDHASLGFGALRRIWIDGTPRD